MRLAARGARDMGQGEELIQHSAERAMVERQARRVHVRALAAGAGLTALAVGLVTAARAL